MLQPVHSSSGIPQDHGSCFSRVTHAWHSAPPISRCLASPGVVLQRGLNSIQILLWLCARVGICINFNKTCLRPVFLGVNILTPPLKAFPTWTLIDNLFFHLRAFSDSPHLTAKERLTLLSYMASLIYLVAGAQLRMQSLQFHLRSQWSSFTHDDSVWIAWTPDNLMDLHWWMLESNLLAGSDLRDVSLDFLLYTDASTHGWGCSLLHHAAGGLWSEIESTLRINLLELWAVWPTLLQVQHLLQGKTVGFFTDKQQLWHTFRTRGHSFVSPQRQSSVNVALDGVQVYFSLASIHQWITQHGGRFHHPEISCPFIRVDSPSRGLLGYVTTMEYASHQSFCHQPELQASCICLPISGSHGHCNRCLSILLGPHGALCLPPISSNPASPLPTPVLMGTSVIPNCSILTEQGVVHRPATNNCRHSLPSTNVSRPPAATTLPSLPQWSPCTSTDRVETIQ